MEEFFVITSRFVADHWGDLASILGLGLTIWVALRAKAAAEQARDAARQVKNRIWNLDTLADVSASIGTLGEIRTLQRLRAWDLVLDRYGILRRQLVRIEQMNVGLTDAQRAQVAGALGQFRIIEEKIERARALQRYDQIDSAKFNGIVAKQIDALEGVMIAVRQAGV